MKELKVIDELCIGCGACIAIDGEHFEFSDSGLSKVKTQENLESPTLIEAIEACPTNAIKLEESAEDKTPEVNIDTNPNEAAA